jgi:hypothetical protein
MWAEIVERKQEWVGGILEDREEGYDPIQTEITDISLSPNGEDSAFFLKSTGRILTVGFDVHVGGVIGGEKGWLTFASIYGGKFRIQQKK